MKYFLIFLREIFSCNFENIEIFFALICGYVVGVTKMNEIYFLRAWLIQTGEPGWLDTELWVYLSDPSEEDGDLCALHQFLWLLLFLVLEGEDCFTYLPGRLHYSCCDRVRVCGCSYLARVAPLPSRPPGSSMARLGRRGHSTGTRFMCAMLIDLESFIYWIWNMLHSITMGFAAPSCPGWIRLFTWSGTCWHWKLP